MGKTTTFALLFIWLAVFAVLVDGRLLKKKRRDLLSPTLVQNGDSVVLQNGFVSVVVDLVSPGISTLYSDFYGKGNFSSPNILAGNGIALEYQGTNHQISYSNGYSRLSPLNYIVLNQTSEVITILIPGIVDNLISPQITSNWTVMLEKSRYFNLSVSIQSLKTANVTAVRLGSYFNAWSIYAMCKYHEELSLFLIIINHFC
eukprot:TRINITY_DN10534_c0_g1_i1.p1 TRINITY_DN10534_c0_g1~~TRINITY_DN10534_c0_g1_i1.p1  ORF type:complete len:202 (-),score=10.82 TRINITY_DN10534_c0_g1_i1:242-847(-)